MTIGRALQKLLFVELRLTLAAGLDHDVPQHVIEADGAADRIEFHGRKLSAPTAAISL